jgi:predicted NAD/FAD-dependent oxidoreductase
MIDLAAERSHVRANRIPETVLLLLGATALLANGLLASVLGRNKKEARLHLHLLAFSIWLVIGLIVDFDRPRRGLVQVSQEPLAWISTDDDSPKSAGIPYGHCTS